MNKDNIGTDLELFRDLINKTSDAIFVADPPSGLFIFVNDKACESLGYDRSELLKIGVMDIEAALPDNFSWKKHLNELRHKRSLMFEGIHKRKDGTKYPVEANISYVVLNSAEYLVTIVRDTSERERTEGATRLQSEITANISEGIYLVSANDLKIVYANPRMEEIFGYGPGEMNGKHVSIINASSEGDPKDTARQIEESLKNTGRWKGEVLNIRKDGSTFWGQASISLFHHPDYGEVYVSLQSDITERKRAEAALRAREKQLAESQRIAQVGSWEHNLKTGSAFWSDELFRLFGLDPGKDKADFGVFFGMVHPDDQPALRKAIDETLGDRKPYGIDYRFVAGDGTTRVFHAQAELLPDETGDPAILSGTAQDITELKEAEEKIRRSEEFIRNILDTVDEGFIVIDRDFRILTANRAYCDQVSGYDEQITGRYCYEISHGTSRRCYKEGEECVVRQVFADGQPHSAIHRHTDSYGHLLFLERKGYPVRDVSGNIISVIETINNITERHLLEEERLKTQKLESIGTLAGGIAHDFNNLLQGIFGYISMTKISLDRKEKALSMLEQAENALQQSVSLTSQLLTFSKGGRPVKKIISLLPVIENALKFALSGSRSGYRLDIEPDLWHADADGGQLGQVIQNMVINADQAMPGGGTVVITAGNILNQGNMHPGLPGGRHVEISVQDSGIGIPAKYLQNIFDPYFTTKDKGSGLGLATSYSIVRSHGGIINVVSEPGKGTTFHVYLPAVEAPGEIEQAVTVSSSVVTGKVLLMDDEETVRMVTGQFLSSLNLEGAFAENGEEALKQYLEAADKGRPFDVVILDLTVRGGMGGKETIAQLLAVDPHVKAIVSSGYSEDAVVADYRKYGFAARLTKPYRLEDLRDTLNELLSK